MGQDTSVMDDAALDAVLDAQYGDDGLALGENVIVENGSEDVSPSDDIDEGQSEAEEEVAHVDESTSDDEDPEDSLSTDEDEDEVENDEVEVDNESTDDNSEIENKVDSEADEEPVAFQPLRADGKEYPIESMQELYSLASKGINSDRKWNESAEGRKVSSMMKKTGITQADLNLLVDLKSGDQRAIASLLKGAEIDPLDIDVDALDGKYEPKDHSTNDFEMQLDEVVAKVKTRPRYEESVSVIMDSWDGASKDAFYKNPQILELLNTDMQIGPDGTSMYDKVTPLADKMKALDTGVKRSDLEYYQMAGAKILNSMNKSYESSKKAEQTKKQKDSDKQKTLDKKKKAAASSGGTRAGKKVLTPSQMSDSELDEFLEKTS